MRHALWLPLLLVLGTAATAVGDDQPVDLAAAARAAGTVNGLCPVMLRPVTPKGGSAAYRGERIGFCCPGCAAKFRADPLRYVQPMRDDRARFAYTTEVPDAATLRAKAAAVRAANGICPVMGRPVTPKGGSSTYEGQRIAFCCPGCKGKFEADPEHWMREMRADPGAYGYDRPGPTHTQLREAREAAGTVNGKCPVVGGLVTKAGGTAEYKGASIGFCCAGCKEKFQVDPEHYMRRMRTEPVPYGYMPEGDGR
jgi:P-type Cu+ transporter